jgi:hypothetical protein
MDLMFRSCVFQCYRKYYDEFFLNSINDKQDLYWLSSMVLLWSHRIKFSKIACLFFIIFTVIFITSNFVFDTSRKYHYSSSSLISVYFLAVLLSFSLHYLLIKSNQLCPQSNYTNSSKVFPVDNILLDLTFSSNQTYHHNGIAYDYYSITDLRKSKASCQWKVWPLLNEQNRRSSIRDIETSPFVISKLPFVDVIYVITDRNLTHRHENLKKALLHQGISLNSIKWRMKWTHKTCNSNSSHSYVYQRLNLKEKPLSNHIYFDRIRKKLI